MPRRVVGLLSALAGRGVALQAPNGRFVTATSATRYSASARQLAGAAAFFRDAVRRPAHLHITANMRAGGLVISGEPFDRFGIAAALGQDAKVHGRDGGLDYIGNLLRGANPVGTHDTHGWPTFTGWPVYNTQTHQQTYYVPLCRLEPRRSGSCDETQSITAHQGSALAAKINRMAAVRAPGRLFGVGLGTDTGGFSSLPGPRADAATHPLAYPFRSFDGHVMFTRERSGSRVFDLNRDGVAHDGLIPDLLADTERAAGGRRALSLLWGSAEAYLEMWERAVRHR